MDGYDWDHSTGERFKVKWVPSSPSRRYANVVAYAEEGRWIPAEGYTWVTNPPGPGDFRVRWEPGQRSRTHPNVVAGESGWEPADGYVWLIGPNDPGKRVIWTSGQTSRRYPNVISSDVPGYFHAAPGYELANPGVDLQVIETHDVQMAISRAREVYTLAHQIDRVRSLSNIATSDRLEAALKIIAAPWLIRVPNAASSSQRDAVIAHARKELKLLLQAAQDVALAQMKSDVSRLTPYWWNVFRIEQRRAIERMERDIAEASTRAASQIESDRLITVYRSGSTASALGYWPHGAMRELTEFVRTGPDGRRTYCGRDRNCYSVVSP